MIQVVTDMGSSRIAVMAAEVLEGRQVRVLSVESKPSKGVRYGFVEQPSKVAYDIGELVRQLQNSARLPEARQLCVSLNAKTMKQVPLRVIRSLGFGRTVTAPLVDGMLEECYTKFNQPEVAVYDVIPLCYELDGTRMDDPVGRKGNELRGTYHIIVGNASIREELGRVFERTAAIKPYDYMPLGVEALSAALLDDGEREAGVALVNLGDTTTTLAVYAQGALQQLLVVPLGGRHITHDIQELGISEANAERLKRLTGVALKRLVTSPKRVNVPAVEEGTADVQVRTDFLATIIEMRLAEMMDPIFKALEQSPFPLEAGIVLAGGGAKLDGVADFMEEYTGLPVRFGDHSPRLSDGTDERYADPAYAQLVGTALLLHDYLAENPAPPKPEPPKPTKNNKRGWREKIKGVVIDLFSDDQYLKNEENKDGKRPE